MPLTMTRDEFERYAVDPRRPPTSKTGVFLRHGRVVVFPPYDLQPCACGDANCHGWRLVELRPATLQAIPIRQR